MSEDEHHRVFVELLAKLEVEFSRVLVKGIRNAARAQLLTKFLLKLLSSVDQEGAALEVLLDRVRKGNFFERRLL